jgi:hypothetical protein
VLGVQTRVRLMLSHATLYRARMTTIGNTIDETGTLIREGGAFVLRRDAGGRYELQLRRVPVDYVEKRVRVIGTLIADGLVSAEGVGPA